MAEPVVVVGGGVGGLMAALALGRAGHEVTVLERDPLPPTADAEEAFRAERRGAPQVHQTHGFLARLQVTLRERFPDVLDDLIAAGGSTMPMTAALGEPRPGDEDLRVIVVRRTTFEWVLRRAALAQPGVQIRTGSVVTGLVAAGTTGSVEDEPRMTGVSLQRSRPVVTAVRLDDGSVLGASEVILCTGRRGDVPGWLGELGVDVPETVHESGLMYLTRWYRRSGAEPVVDPKLGGDLGFVKYLGVPGDGDTLSVTLAVRTSDRELRSALSDPDRFDEACRLLPGPDQFFTGGPMEPIGGVRPMTSLINRLRRFTDEDGAPTVLGLHALGDAHTTTNPLYGRGCALAAVQAVLLADAFAAHPGDPVARATAYEAANRREVEPWFEASVQMDRMGAEPIREATRQRSAVVGARRGTPARDPGALSHADPSGRGSLGAAADGPRSDAARAMSAVFVAAGTDPVIGRAIARLMNLLTTPAEMMSDPEVLAAVTRVMADLDAYPVPPSLGPTRTELLDRLGGDLVA